MDFLNHLLYPPRYDHLILAQYFIIVVSLIFVFYASFLFGGTFFSLIYRLKARDSKNPLWLRFSRDIINTLGNNFFVGFGFLILPLIVLGIAYSQVLYDSQIKISQYFAYATLFFLLGLIFVTFYRRRLNAQDDDNQLLYFWGILGLFCLLLGFYVYSNSTLLVLDSEKWNHIRSAFPNFFSAASFAYFLYIMHLILALTAAGILFLFLNWQGGKENMEPEYRTYVGKFSATIALIFTLIQPVFLLWVVRNLPHVSRTSAAYGLIIAAFFVLAIISYFLYTVLVNRKWEMGVPVFILFLVYVLVVNVFSHVSMDRTLSEHLIVLKQESEKFEAQMEAKREELKPRTEEASVKMGEKIYNQICSACHRFDQKIVGPPYVEVLPKYENNQEALVKYILNPVKKNPAYPPMPNPPMHTTSDDNINTSGGSERAMVMG